MKIHEKRRGDGHESKDFYRSGCVPPFSYGEILFPISWKRSLRWLKLLDATTENPDLVLKEKYRKLLITAVNEIHYRKRKNFARALYFSNRNFIGKIIDRYWSRIDPRDDKYQKKLSLEEDEQPYKWLRYNLWKCTECWGTYTDQLRVLNLDENLRKLGIEGPVNRLNINASEEEKEKKDDDKQKIGNDQTNNQVITTIPKIMFLQLGDKNKEQSDKRLKEILQLKVRYSLDYIIGYWVIHRLSDRVALTEVLLPLKTDIFLPYNIIQQILLDKPQNENWDFSIKYRSDNRLIQDFNNQMNLDDFDDTVNEWRKIWRRAFTIDSDLRLSERVVLGLPVSVVTATNHFLPLHLKHAVEGYMEWYISSRIAGLPILNQDERMKPIQKSTFPIFGTNMSSYDYHLFKIAVWQKLNAFIAVTYLVDTYLPKYKLLLKIPYPEEVGFKEGMKFDLEPFPSDQEIDHLLDQDLGAELKYFQGSNSAFRNQLNSHIRNRKKKNGGTTTPSFISPKNIMQNGDSNPLEEIQKKIRFKMEDERENEEFQTLFQNRKLRDGFPLFDLLDIEQKRNNRLENFFSILHLTSERENAIYHAAQSYLPIFKEQIKSIPHLRKEMLLLQTALGEDRNKTIKSCYKNGLFSTFRNTSIKILDESFSCSKFLNQVRQMLRKQFEDTSKITEIFKLRAPILMIQAFLKFPKNGINLIIDRTLQLSLFSNLDLSSREEITMYRSSEDKHESDFLKEMNPQRSPTKIYFGPDNFLHKEPKICTSEHFLGGKEGVTVEKIDVEVECQTSEVAKRHADQEIFDALAQESKRLLDELKEKKKKLGIIDGMNSKLRLSQKESQEIRQKLEIFENDLRSKRKLPIKIHKQENDLSDDEISEATKAEKRRERVEFKENLKKKALGEWDEKLGLSDDAELKGKFQEMLDGFIQKDIAKKYPTVTDLDKGITNEDDKASALPEKEPEKPADESPKQEVEPDTPPKVDENPVR